MAGSSITATQSIRFENRDSSGSNKFMFEREPPGWWRRHDFYLRLYHGGKSFDLRTSDGAVTRLERGVKEIQGEGLVFSGGDTVTPRYPVTGGGQSLTLGGSGTIHLRRRGAFFDENGKSVSPSFTFDPVSGQVKSSIRGYGLVIANYTSPYTVIGFDYRRDVHWDGRSLTRYIFSGTVFAFAEETKDVASYTVPEFAYEVEDPDNDKVEVYRDVSFAQVTSDGVYERHKDWPAKTFVPNDYPGSVLDVKRCHEVVYVDKWGRTQSDRYSIKLEKPFAGGHPSDTYPVIKTEYADISEDLPSDLKAAAERVLSAKKAKSEI